MPWTGRSLTVLACNEKNNSSENENDSTVNETEVKAPKMDIHTATFMGDINAIKQHIAAKSDLNLSSKPGYDKLPPEITI